MPQTLKCEIVRLRGKSLKGKDRIKKFGDVWFVQENWPLELFIMSIHECSTLGRDLRWIGRNTDKDFEIIPFFESDGN